jgi:hypothetical protein
MRILLPLAALVALSACDTKPTEIGPGAARTGATPTPTAAATPIKLPPSIAASKQYRCADNSLALVEWYSDGLSASVKTDAKASPVRVEAPAAGEAMVGGGYSLKGTKDDANVTFASPAKPKGQRCHV